MSQRTKNWLGVLVAVLALSLQWMTPTMADVDPMFMDEPEPQPAPQPAPKPAPAPAPAPVYQPQPAPQPAPQPQPQPQPEPQPQIQTSTAMQTQLQYAVGRRVFPSRVSQGGSLVIEKHAPVEVRPNAPFTYKIKVINPTEETLRKVIAHEVPQEGYQILRANPSGQAVGDGSYRWMLGDIPAKSSREIEVVAQANKLDQIASCVYVTHEVVGCWAIKVTEPKLQLAQTLPTKASVCEEIPINLVVTNPGTGNAENVQVVYPLPQGLTTLDGQQQATFDVGKLGPNESKELTLKVKAQRAGEYPAQGTATASSGLRTSVKGKLQILQPVLAIKKDAPSRSLIARPLKYAITVENRGDGDAQNVVVKDKVPGDVKILSASAGGKLNPRTNEVLWEIGTLPAKQTRRLELNVKPVRPGDLTNTATAEAFCVSPVSASTTTKVTGVPAILLEVVDLEDPIELGTDVTYRIRVTNQGTSTGTNIIVSCSLENTMQYIGSQGATQGQLVGERQITFAPLPALPPKAKATWEIKVKAVGAGDVRFSVKLDSDQMSRPVLETEATNFYE